MQAHAQNPNEGISWDKLKNKLVAELDEVYINGSTEHRLPHNLSISFAYVEGESLLMGLNDIAVSGGGGDSTGTTTTTTTTTTTPAGATPLPPNR